MAQDAEARTERQRAEENERLRRLAAAELASTRVELARSLEDRVEMHRDLNLLAERLSVQADLASSAQADLTSSAQEETARVQTDLDAARATIQRQAALITRLEKQMGRPARLLAKKILRRSPRQSRSDNAS